MENWNFLYNVASILSSSCLRRNLLVAHIRGLKIRSWKWNSCPRFAVISKIFSRHAVSSVFTKPRDIPIMFTGCVIIYEVLLNYLWKELSNFSQERFFQMFSNYTDRGIFISWSVQVLSRFMFVASKTLMVSTTVFRDMVEYFHSYCSDAFGIYEWTFGMERSEAHTLWRFRRMVYLEMAINIWCGKWNTLGSSIVLLLSS